MATLSPLGSEAQILASSTGGNQERLRGHQYRRYRPRFSTLCAAADVDADLFTRHPDGSGCYAGRLLCHALCQGTALHYVDHKNGVLRRVVVLCCAR